MSLLAGNSRILAIFLAGVLSMSAVNVFATVLIPVDSADDGADDNPGNGFCHTAAGTCTLRAAIMEANRTSGAGATIVLPAGTYKLQIGAHDADGEDNGDLNLSVPPGYTPGVTTITGTSGAALTIIDAQQIDRVLRVDPSRTVFISGVTLSNGLISDPQKGAGIDNSGTLTLTDIVIRDNTVSASSGGGIYNGGVLYLTRGMVSGNKASNGGAIYNDGLATLGDTTMIANQAIGDIGAGSGGAVYNFGVLTANRCTLSSNSIISGKNRGGAIFNFDGGVISLDSCTISFNSADFGGGIFAEGSLTILNTTVAFNSSNFDGGGIYAAEGLSSAFNGNIYSSTIIANDADQDQTFDGAGGGVYIEGSSGNGFNIYNTILAGNIVANHQEYDDCSAISGGVLKTHARNLFGSGMGCTIDQISGSYADVNSLAYLGSLRNNGGPTQTVALLAGSNAIDGTIAGTGCKDSQSVAIPVDQRGYPRTGMCDVGAFEYDDIFIAGFE